MAYSTACRLLHGVPPCNHPLVFWKEICLMYFVPNAQNLQALAMTSHLLHPSAIQSKCQCWDHIEELPWNLKNMPNLFSRTKSHLPQIFYLLWSTLVDVLNGSPGRAPQRCPKLAWSLCRYSFNCLLNTCWLFQIKTCFIVPPSTLETILLHFIC